MAAAAKIEILVGAQVGEAKARLENFFSSMQTGLQKLADGMRLGLGIDVAQKAIGALQQIPAKIEAMVERGVGFNRTLEDSRLGIAAVLKQFDKAGEFKTFDDAMRAAGGAIEALQVKAKESPASFQELVRAFQSTAGAASAARIPLQKQVDLVVLMSQALAGMGIRSEQIIQESRALLTGNITEDAAAARMLEITRAQIEAAKESGRLFEFLSERMSAFAEAGKVGAQTFSTRLGNLGDSIDQVFGRLTKPIFETLKQTFQGLTDAVSDPRFEAGLTAAAQRLDTLIGVTAQMVVAGVKNIDLLADAFQLLAVAIAAATTALIAFGAVGMVNAVRGVAALVAAVPVASGLVWQLGARLGAVVTALSTIPGAITLAAAAFAGWELGKFVDDLEVSGLKIGAWAQMAYLEIFGAWERIKAYLAGAGDWIFATMAVQWERIVVMIKEKGLQIATLLMALSIGPAMDLSAMEDSLRRSQATLAALEKQRDDGLASNVQEAADRYRREREALDRALAETVTGTFESPARPKAKPAPARTVTPPKTPPAGPDNEALLAEINQKFQQAVSTRVELLNGEYDEKRRLLDRTVFDEEAKNVAIVQLDRWRQAELTKIREEEAAADEQRLENLIQKQSEARQKAVRAELEVMGDKLRADRDDIALQRTKLDVDFRMAETAKKSQRVQLLEQEIKALDTIIARLKEMRAAETDDAAKQSVNDQLRQVEAERRGLSQDRTRISGGPDPFSFVDQFTAVMTELKNRWGTWASQMANSFATVFNGAIGTVSSNLTGILMRTQTVGEGLRNMWMGITEMVIQEIVRMGVQWFATHVVMAGISSAFSAVRQAIWGAETAAQAGHATTRQAILTFEEGGKVTITAGGATAREAIRLGETASEGGHAAVRAGTHAGSEGAKTGATFFGAIARGAIRVGETIFHGVQCGVRLVTYIASEAGMTAASIVNTVLRLPLILAQTTAFLVLAGIMAMSALAGIPVVGPALALGAMALIVTAGMKLMGAFKAGGFTGKGSRDGIAGVVHNEEFVVNATATDAIGVENLEAMQANPRGFFAGLGRLAREARGVDRVVVAGLARPDYSGGEARGESGGGSGAGGSGGGVSPVVNLPRPQVSVAVLNNRDEMRAFLESAAGEQLIVDVMNKRRLDFGLGT